MKQKTNHSIEAVQKYLQSMRRYISTGYPQWDALTGNLHSFFAPQFGKPQE